ncbi:MAG: CPBP family intramembrane glutamic endopeptidase [Janthinobacterium lividum]
MSTVRPPSRGERAATRRTARLAGRAVGVVKPLLIDKVERDHQQSDAQFLRRRIVVGVTLVIGATLLGLSFSTEPGDPSFYPLTFALAATWVVGSLASGPLHLGHIVFHSRVRRPVVTPVAVGLLLGGIFVVGGLVTREIPVLAQFTNNVLGYAKAGSIWLVALVTLVNGVAEELFFRGALFAAIGRRNPVVISTLLYALATVAGGNPVLVFAAAFLGLVTGLQRRAGGGVLAPVLTHITWSTTMLLVLPHIFR